MEGEKKGEGEKKRMKKKRGKKKEKTIKNEFMKMDTCPFPKGKRQCLIRDTKHSWVMSIFFNSLYF